MEAPARSAFHPEQHHAYITTGCAIGVSSGSGTAFVEPGSPLSAVSCGCTCRATDELLNGEIFYTLREAQIIIEEWALSRLWLAQTPAGQRDATTTPRDHTVRSATDHRLPKLWSRWTTCRPCSNFHPCPLR